MHLWLVLAAPIVSFDPTDARIERVTFSVTIGGGVPSKGSSARMLATAATPPVDVGPLPSKALLAAMEACGAGGLADEIIELEHRGIKIVVTASVPEGSPTSGRAVLRAVGTDMSCFTPSLQEELQHFVVLSDRPKISYGVVNAPSPPRSKPPPKSATLTASITATAKPTAIPASYLATGAPTSAVPAAVASTTLNTSLTTSTIATSLTTSSQPNTVAPAPIAAAISSPTVTWPPPPLPPPPPPPNPVPIAAAISISPVTWPPPTPPPNQLKEGNTRPFVVAAMFWLGILLFACVSVWRCSIRAMSQPAKDHYQILSDSPFEAQIPNEWWKPLDWIVLVSPPTAKPAGGDEVGAGKKAPLRSPPKRSAPSSALKSTSPQSPQRPSENELHAAASAAAAPAAAASAAAKVAAEKAVAEKAAAEKAAAAKVAAEKAAAEKAAAEKAWLDKAAAQRTAADKVAADKAAAEKAAAEKAAAEKAAAAKVVAEKAAAEKAAAAKVAAEKASAEQAAAEQASAERAVSNEWWKPLDWMVLVSPPTAKPAGDDGKAEAEKAEAAASAAVASAAVAFAGSALKRSAPKPISPQRHSTTHREPMAQETVRVQELALVQRMAPTSLPLYLQRLPAETAAAEAAAAEKAAGEAAAAAEKAAAENAAAEQEAAERAAAEQAAAEQASAERAVSNEWWKPLDWIVLVSPPTAKPAGDDGKAEAEKAEAAEAVPRPPAPHREYNLGGYIAPPPTHSKVDFEANLDSARAAEVVRYKARVPPSTSPRMHVITTPEPWLGGSVSTERLERMVSRRGGRRGLLSRRAGEEAQPDTKALAEPSHRSAVTSAIGWSPSSWLR